MELLLLDLCTTAASPSTLHRAAETRPLESAEEDWWLIKLKCRSKPGPPLPRNDDELLPAPGVEGSMPSLESRLKGLLMILLWSSSSSLQSSAGTVVVALMGSFCKDNRVDADDDPCLESDPLLEAFSRALVMSPVVMLFTALAPTASTPSTPFTTDC